MEPISSNGIAECVPYTEASTFNLTTVYQEDFGHHVRQHSRWEDFPALTPTPSSGRPRSVSLASKRLCLLGAHLLRLGIRRAARPRRRILEAYLSGIRRR